MEKNIDNYKLLIESIERNDLKAIKSLVEVKNVDINSVDKSGYSALHCAAEEGHPEIAEYLISNGAKLDELGFKQIGNIEGFIPNTPLFSALTNNHIEVAMILIKHGARTDIRNELGDSILDAAILSEEVEPIVLVLYFFDGFFFDINEYHSQRGNTPLSRAFEWDSIDSVRCLLERGADYRKYSKPDGFSPLHCAIYGKTDLDYDVIPLAPIKLLLDHVGRKEGEEKMIEYINYQCTAEGRTALHYTCIIRDYRATKFLLHCGANPEIKDKEGKTPLDLSTHSYNGVPEYDMRIRRIFDLVADPNREDLREQEIQEFRRAQNIFDHFRSLMRLTFKVNTISWALEPPSPLPSLDSVICKFTLKL